MSSSRTKKRKQRVEGVTKSSVKKQFFNYIKAKSMILSDYSRSLISLLFASTIFLAPTAAQTNPPASTPETSNRDAAEPLNQQVLQLIQQGQYQKALPLAQQALEMAERELGTEHLDLTPLLTNLAEIYRHTGDYNAAEPLYQRALAIREQALGAEHPQVATSLNNLGVLYMEMGEYRTAEPLFERSIRIYEEADSSAPNLANTLTNLAQLYQEIGNYSAAEPLLKRAITLRENALGTEHADVADSLTVLGFLYMEMGNYSAAEPLLQRALSLRETAWGAEHPWVAQSLNGLAWLYFETGNYKAAEPLLQRALRLYENSLGAEHPWVATNLNNLASLYVKLGDYRAAEPLFERSLAIYEQALGSEHPLVATNLHNLAEAHRNLGNYSIARELLGRAIALRERILGPTHPDLALSLNNLAEVYRSQKDYSNAEPLLQRSLAIYEQALGADHPAIATTANNLAWLYQAQGDIERANVLIERSTRIEEKNLDLILTIGSESQKQAYMSALSGITNRILSLHLRDAPNNPKSAELALTTLLRRKGRILDALIDSLQLLRQNLTAADQALLDELSRTRSQLAALIFSQPNNLSLVEYRQDVANLKAEAEDLEAQLSRRSAAFRVASQPATIAAVQQLIPDDAALVELVLYHPVDSQRNEWDDPHYAAYILHGTGAPQWVELGNAASINKTARTLQESLGTRGNLDYLRAQARQLDAVLMQPIRAKLGDKRHILLSPDSQLNLIPFAALIDENQQYLVENYTITYLTTGRDLIRLFEMRSPRQSPVIIANPNYDEAVNSGLPARQRGEDDRRSRDLNQLYFTPLPGTAKEAEAIASLLADATLLTQAQATENALKQVTAPNILHIATHGFFLEVDLVATTANPIENRGLAGVYPRYDDETASQNSSTQENPLLRSGLALAGFNTRTSGEEDGVLTALEAANLNLRGTKLVVLSACETGVGDISNGEGVYGLRRAFAIAGAESQLISLWQVSDRGTKDLMVDYYQRLIAGEGRSEALRQVQLKMLTHPIYQHPYFWAAFIPSGQWGAIP
jgi:CHAT domain-containing protein/Tfp pilus assembly protein PilF